MENINMAREATEGRAHYYVSSASNWKVSTDLFKAMSEVKAYDKKMVRNRGMAGSSMTAYWVPLPIDANYNINGYVPEVDGLLAVAHVDYTDELTKYSKRVNKR